MPITKARMAPNDPASASQDPSMVIQPIPIIVPNARERSRSRQVCRAMPQSSFHGALSIQDFRSILGDTGNPRFRLLG